VIFGRKKQVSRVKSHFGWFCTVTLQCRVSVGSKSFYTVVCHITCSKLLYRYFTRRVKSFSSNSASGDCEFHLINVCGFTCKFVIYKAALSWCRVANNSFALSDGELRWKMLHYHWWIIAYFWFTENQRQVEKLIYLLKFIISKAKKAWFHSYTNRQQNTMQKRTQT